jgi:hypothetical protein
MRIASWVLLTLVGGLNLLAGLGSSWVAYQVGQDQIGPVSLSELAGGRPRAGPAGAPPPPGPPALPPYSSSSCLAPTGAVMSGPGGRSWRARSWSPCSSWPASPFWVRAGGARVRAQS